MNYRSDQPEEMCFGPQQCSGSVTFDKNLDPQIRTTILQIRISYLFSVVFKMPTKISFFYLPILTRGTFTPIHFKDKSYEEVTNL
jgi:hypothetical protein